MPHPLEWLTWKRLQYPSVGPVVGHLAFPSIAGGTVLAVWSRGLIRGAFVHGPGIAKHLAQAFK